MRSLTEPKLWQRRFSLKKKIISKFQIRSRKRKSERLWHTLNIWFFSSKCMETNSIGVIFLFFFCLSCLLDLNSSPVFFSLWLFKTHIADIRSNKLILKASQPVFFFVHSRQPLKLLSGFSLMNIQCLLCVCVWLCMWHILRDKRIKMPTSNTDNKLTMLH